MAPGTDGLPLVPLVAGKSPEAEVLATILSRFQPGAGAIVEGLVMNEELRRSCVVRRSAIDPGCRRNRSRDELLLWHVASGERSIESDDVATRPPSPKLRIGEQRARDGKRDNDEGGAHQSSIRANRDNAVVKQFLCRDETETIAAGREIARMLPRDATVHLVGDLGAGKTFLARAIATELGADPREVASPSFAIVHEYPVASGPPIIHIDGYRLTESRREWFEIGIPEILAGPGVKLIEWPKRELEEFEDTHVEVTITVRDDGARDVSFRIA